MIKMHVRHENIELEMRGSDELILDELSLAIIRMLHALEQCDGNPLEDNLTVLVLSLIARHSTSQNPPC